MQEAPQEQEQVLLAIEINDESLMPLVHGAFFSFTLPYSMVEGHFLVFGFPALDDDDEPGPAIISPHAATEYFDGVRQGQTITLKEMVKGTTE